MAMKRNENKNTRSFKWQERFGHRLLRMQREDVEVLDVSGLQMTHASALALEEIIIDVEVVRLVAWAEGNQLHAHHLLQGCKRRYALNLQVHFVLIL